MLYIFEDDKDKALSKLFKAAYPLNVQKQFLFAGGNGELKKQVRKNIDKTDFVFVFIDIVPDNDVAISVFMDLINLEKEEYRDKLFIFPIVCAEYYFIKAMSKLGLGRNMTSVQWCVSREFYLHDSEIKNSLDLQKCKTFEKYCKFVRNRSLLRCMQDENAPKEIYFKCDCKCEKPVSGACVEMSMLEKASRLLSEYAAIPSGSLFRNADNLPISCLRGLRTCFIVEHNRIVTNYRSIDSEHAERYTYIREDI